MTFPVVKRSTVRRALVLVLVLVAVIGSGCGTSGSSSGSTADGHINVLAAASLTESFNELQRSLRSTAPELDLTLSYAGSQALAQQIQDGAPADVFASADEKNMKKLVAAGLVETPVVFARNTLEIAVAPGNPKHITGLSDLARSDLVVVLADPAVPVGDYAQRVLAKAGVRAKPKSLELDVKSALTRVTSGEADATIVYVSDVKAAGSSASGVPIAARDNVVASYPIAVVRSSGNERAARAFIDAVRSPKGQSILRSYGFLTA